MADGSGTGKSDASPAERHPAERHPAERQGGRRRFYVLHIWVGFHLAVLMALVLATGTLATLSHEIDWLTQDDMRVVPDGDRVSWNTMARALRAEYPDHVLVSLEAMPGHYFAHRARMVDPYGRQVFVHVDQWTGQVTGSTHPLTVQRLFRDWHRYLFMPNFIGLPLVTSMAFILIISLYTGLKTTRKWGTVATRIRVDKGARIAVGDAHKAAGLWGVWFFIVMIVTGIWYLAEFGAAVSGDRFEPARPRLAQERVADFGQTIQDASTARIIAAATDAFPELEPRRIHYAVRAGDPVSVLGRGGSILLRDRANRVSLDPVDLSVIQIQRSQDIGWVAWLNEMADPVHFGSFGGLPTKVIWFVFGLAMTGLSVSGVWLTWRRLRSAAPSRAQLLTFPVLLVSLAFAVPWVQRLQGPAVPDQEQALTPQALGAFDTQLLLARTAQGNPTGDLRLLIASDRGRPNISGVVITVETDDGGPGSEVTRAAGRLGPVTELRAHLPPDLLKTAQALVVRLDLHSGAQLTGRWRLSGARDLAASG